MSLQIKTGPSAYEVRQHLRLDPYHLASTPKPGKEVGDVMFAHDGRQVVTTSGLRAAGAPSAGTPAPQIDRSACTAKRHGTMSAYTQYQCRCADAREAWRLYRKRGREGRREPLRVDSTGTSRRLKALCAIGWSQIELGRRLGLHKDRVASLVMQRYPLVHVRTATLVRDLYERLSGTPGTSVRARNRAARMQWAPPLAWEDRGIDDPAAVPVTTPAGPTTDVDPMAVEMACAGLLVKPKLTLAERDIAIQRMTADGRPAYEIAARIGVDERTVVRARSAMKTKVAAA